MLGTWRGVPVSSAGPSPFHTGMSFDREVLGRVTVPYPMCLVYSRTLPPPGSFYLALTRRGERPSVNPLNQAPVACYLTSPCLQGSGGGELVLAI